MVTSLLWSVQSLGGGTAKKLLLPVVNLINTISFTAFTLGVIALVKESLKGKAVVPDDEVIDEPTTSVITTDFLKRILSD